MRNKNARIPFSLQKPSETKQLQQSSVKYLIINNTFNTDYILLNYLPSAFNNFKTSPKHKVYKLT